MVPILFQKGQLTYEPVYPSVPEKSGHKNAATL